MNFNINDIPEDKSAQPEKTLEILEFEFKSIKDHLREQRNKLLKDSDIYVLPDFPITPENLSIIKKYRNDLRNYMNIIESLDSNSFIPNIPSFPF